MKIRYGTRKSKLALTQSRLAISIAQKSNPQIEFEEKIITTLGDKITDQPLFKVGGQGLFIKEIENALLNGEIDIAIHSLKDLPANLAEGLCILAVGCEEAPNDCLISNNFKSFEDLPLNARIGTSSLRRRAQLLTLRRDLKFTDMRGNIDTRLSKLYKNEADAIILASAGLKRLKINEQTAHNFAINEIIPAVGQGLLAIECRENEKESLLKIFEDFASEKSMLRARAERAFLKRVNGGCSMPICAHAEVLENEIMLYAFMADETCKNSIKQCFHGSTSKPEELGAEAANEFLEAKSLLQIQLKG